MNPGGGMDMQALLQQAQQMQQQLMEAQEQLDEAQVKGSSGGGLVTVSMSGRGSVEDVSIAPEAIDAEDPEAAQTIADLVLAAIRDAEAEVERVQQEKMGPLNDALGGAGGAGGGMPGMPGLPGMPGM